MLRYSLVGSAFYCCPDCFKTLCHNENYHVEKLDNDAFCDCTEIDLGLYKPTPCAVCQDKNKAGCPMHLYYVKVTQKMRKDENQSQR